METRLEEEKKMSKRFPFSAKKSSIWKRKFMQDYKEVMKLRTRRIAIRILRECEKLPSGISNTTISRQLVRSATSIGANYRAACRAKSRADFISKMHFVEEECDESIYWLEILNELSDGKSDSFEDLQKELNEILSVIVTALKTAKGLNGNGKS